MRTALAALLLLVLVGCSETEQPAAPERPPIEGVQSYPGLKHDHLKKGQEPPTYAQTPPAGGPHSQVWLACGVYDEPLPDENVVHSIEHDAIWLTYQPGIPKLAVLTDMTKLNPEYVMVSPYPGQGSPVIASTWGLQLKVESADDPRLVEFIRTYAGAGQGGEKGAGCASGGATLEQARAFNDSQR